MSQFIPSLNEKDIDAFLSICSYSEVKNKEIILKSGRTDDTLLFLLSGSARAYQINQRGKEINNHLRSEGYIFGEALVFSNTPQILNIEAIGGLHYLKFDVSKLEALRSKMKT